MAKLRFKGYEFSYNPKTITIKQEKQILAHPLPQEKSVFQQDMGKRPIEIFGEGELFGEQANKQFKEIYSLFQSEGSGLLTLPHFKPVYCFLAEIKNIKRAGPELISYSFKFIEDVSKRGDYI